MFAALFTQNGHTIDPVTPSSNTTSWPYGPLVTQGRNMVNQVGQEVVYAGANWPGHLDAMIPEGLQYQSVAGIVSQIKGMGLNVIRLTYAIEMIDDIFDDNADQTLQRTLIKALGQENGTDIMNKILKNNPQFSENSTRLDLFDGVAKECYNQQIYVHLDNHISRAGWCCLPFDGNGWFGDYNFPTFNWTRGLTYMATHAGNNWQAFTSMSLRNELRNPSPSGPVNATYSWYYWYPNMVWAANCINYFNPQPLIFFSGLGYDSGVAEITEAQDLGGGRVFNLSDFSYRDKIIFEIHNYANGYNGTCADFAPGLYSSGYDAMDDSANTTAKNIAPVVMSEFGFQQDGPEYTWGYARCLREYLTDVKGGWMQWVLGGSYYIKLGVQNSIEPWGLLDEFWSGYTAPPTVGNYTIPFAKAVTS